MIQKICYGLTVVAMFLGATGTVFAQTARLQVIHNSPDPAVATVDVYVNAGEAPFLDDFKFRDATPFVDVPAGAELGIGLAPGTSTGPGDIIATIPVGPLTEGTSYVLVATGLLTPDAFPANPDGADTSFKLLAFIGHEAATGNPAFDLATVHGVPDAPAVNATAVAGPIKIPFVMGMEYGTYYVPENTTGEGDAYQSSTPAAFVVEVAPTAAPETVVASFAIDLSALSGQAAVALASGFLAPQSASLPGFGMLLVLPDGTTVFLPRKLDAEIEFKVDMEVEIATGNFDPATDLVVVAGSFNGWSTTADTLAQDFVDPNLFTKIVTLSGIETPVTHEYKFVTGTAGDGNPGGWESIDNRKVVITGGEADVDGNGAIDISAGETPTFNNRTLADFFSQEVTVTFQVDMRPAFYFFADSLYLPSDIQTGETVSEWDKSVFANGPISGAPNGWEDWGPENLGTVAELKLHDDGATAGDALAGDSVYTFQVTYPVFAPRKGDMKFGTAGYDNESLFGANHKLTLPDNAAAATVNLIFGAMEDGEGGYKDDLYDPYIALYATGPQVVRGGGDPEPPTPYDFEVEFKVDMEVEIATGNFDPATDLVVVAGSFNGWNTTADTLAQDFVNPNLFSKLIEFENVVPPATHEYKFVTGTAGDGNPSGWESVDNRKLTLTGNETDEDGNGLLDVDPGTPTYNNRTLADFFSQEVTVTFQVDMRPAFYFFADSLYLPSDIQTGETVSEWDKSVFANGPLSGAPNGWEDWGPENLGSVAELELHDDGTTGGDAVAGDSVYTFQVTYAKFAPRKGDMKFGTAGYDNESLFGANHKLALPDDAPEATVNLIFGAMENGEGGYADDLFDYYIALTYGGPDIVIPMVVRRGGDVGDTNVDVEQLDVVVPDRFVLGNNYPNPFNPTTTFEYTVPRTELVTINVYDVSGRLVDQVVNQVQSPGTYRATFDAMNLASGVYLYQLRAGNTVITNKMLLMK